jgi:hypothetical protein
MYLFSPNTINIIKPINLRWEQHKACTGQMRKAHIILVEKPEGKDHLGDEVMDESVK